MYIVLFPAVFSCNGTLCEESPDAAIFTSEHTIHTRGVDDNVSADVFVFNDDESGKLDTYQRVTIKNDRACVFSTHGPKILRAVICPSLDRYEWSAVNNEESVCAHIINLKDEDPEQPLVSGSCNLDASLSRQCILEMTGMMAEVALERVKCDFSGKSYSNEELKDAKAYLTNVNASCTIFQEDFSKPSLYYNSGGYNKDDVSQMKYPSMIYKSLGQSIGASWCNPGAEFRCYPNQCSEEAPGTSFTRLVIEGTLCGKTWYWPININREEGSDGVHRNCRYEYEVVLHSTGVEDPDTAISSDMAQVNCAVLPWRDKGESVIHY